MAYFKKNPDWARADDLIVLTEGKVNAASVNLFHALLVSIRHTLSCHIQTAGNDYDRVLLLNSVRKNSIKDRAVKFYFLLHQANVLTCGADLNHIKPSIKVGISHNIGCYYVNEMILKF